MGSTSANPIEERYAFTLSQSLYWCYPILRLEWQQIEQLAREGNLEDLEWLIRLLTTSDPFLVPDMHPIAQIYPLEQLDYPRLVRFLVLLCGVDDDQDFPEWTDETHGLTEEDFIYLDDADPGLAFGLPEGLYHTLFPQPS